MKPTTTKLEAIETISNHGYELEANLLGEWRNKSGNNWGWDGYVRKALPNLVEIIWPESTYENLEPTSNHR